MFVRRLHYQFFFFFNDTATTEIYTLSLHDALPIYLCQRAGGKAYISGSIASLGSQDVIGLQAINCRTGDPLAQEQVTAENKEHILKALGEAATKLREKLGESLSTVEKFDAPLDQATTPSLEALKALSGGVKTLQEKGSAAAIPFFKHAIELD